MRCWNFLLNGQLLLLFRYFHLIFFVFRGNYSSKSHSNFYVQSWKQLKNIFELNTGICKNLKIAEHWRLTALAYRIVIFVSNDSSHEFDTKTRQPIPSRPHPKQWPTPPAARYSSLTSLSRWTRCWIDEPRVL